MLRRPISRYALNRFLCLTPFVFTFVATAQTSAPNQRAATAIAASATRYQLALDQLTQGHTLEARVLLEDAIRKGGDQPEINLLLAYLLEREGRASAARGVLNRVATSPLAASTLARLKDFADSAPTIELRPTPNTNIAIDDAPDNNGDAPANPARSAVADARLSRLEQAMAQWVNEARAQENLAPLQFNEDLAEIARAHSVEMRDKKYFSHESPTPNLTRPMDRYIAATGHTPRIVAENIYRAWGTQHQLGEKDVRAGQESFLNSPGHRANIMLPSVTRVGIGIAVNNTGDIWITQMFDRPQ